MKQTLIISLALILVHFGYSVSMTESGAYFVQGYIGTFIPLLAGIGLYFAGKFK